MNHHTYVFYGTQPLKTWVEKDSFKPMHKAGTSKQNREEKPSSTIANEIYLVESHRRLTTKEQQLLNNLLCATAADEVIDTASPHSSQRDRCKLWVMPRTGTLSAWSSKATDILRHACQLSSINHIERGILYKLTELKPQHEAVITDWFRQYNLYDPLLESLFFSLDDVLKSRIPNPPAPLKTLSVTKTSHTRIALEKICEALGIHLSEAELTHLLDNCSKVQKPISDLVLMMFAQVNSEHCRHKVFNARWFIDGQLQPKSLFEMIQHTYHHIPDVTSRILSAYSDNGAVLKGSAANLFFKDPEDSIYRSHPAHSHIVIKAETHNHPTQVAPWPGAATGAGGEIRDEAAVGRGALPKAGFSGFVVSDLHIPALKQPWEWDWGKTPNKASALQIMLEGPIGSASFNNEFGRPNLIGFFRTYAMEHPNTFGQPTCWGYHKPIMIAGGLGSIQTDGVKKQPIPVGAKIIVLGGPAMLIGLGGGSASSVQSGTRDAALDFSSVQRSDPEMQRRCQSVIEHCTALGQHNPIIAIHDVGAGGLANAVPELVHSSGRGAHIQLRAIPSADPSLSPLELWCNEAQERYVFAVLPKHLSDIKKLAEREHCPLAVIGEATEKADLLIEDTDFNNYPADLPLSVLLDVEIKTHKSIQSRSPAKTHLNTAPPFFKGIDLETAAKRVLQLPCVGDKSFLVTISDRTVGGLVAQDAMVGPWQIPVSDVGVTSSDFEAYTGEAMAIGERLPIALIDAPASACMAVGEAITNLAAADVRDIRQIALSANWMAAIDEPGTNEQLYKAVQAVAMDLCPALGICIPVGKDSLSMQTFWTDSLKKTKRVTSPVSLIVSAFAPVGNIRATCTPQLCTQTAETVILWIDLAEGACPLGGSALAQVYRQVGDVPAKIPAPSLLKGFFETLQSLKQDGHILAYHDRSDGGLFITLCEMAFASRLGLNIQLDHLGEDLLGILFTEGLGAAIQVPKSAVISIQQAFDRVELSGRVHEIGTPQTDKQIRFTHKGTTLLQGNLFEWQRLWSLTSHHIQRLREDPVCVDQAYKARLDPKDPGLSVTLSYEPSDNWHIVKGAQPRVAILREQGVNGHTEMAAAFTQAGFECVDTPMQAIFSGELDLADCMGLAVCGGFSYADVLGAGRGWAQGILRHPKASTVFGNFFERTHTFTLGVCNGCQMLSHLSALIPSKPVWPKFLPNLSKQFEARLCQVVVEQSPSILLTGMAGSCIPIVVSHGEGRARFEHDAQTVQNRDYVTIRYIDGQRQVTESYPYNPNGSIEGIGGVTTQDGRVTLLMPHPERCFRSVQYSWHPKQWGPYSPWFRLFQNARRWVS